MKTSDFYYDLPKDLIAQTPVEPRDSSRLLVLGRESGSIQHKHFYDIIDFLVPGDLLVVNDSRVLPARIYGIKNETGAKVEFLLLKQISGNRWETLCKPGKRAKQGSKFTFGNGLLSATVAKVKSDGNRVVDFDSDENFFAALDKIGQMPLPPYITEELKDKERYQTVYSNELGSAAAPTAGLCHFHLIFMKNLMIKIDIKQYMQKKLVVLLLRLRVFILQKNYCKKSQTRASILHMSHFMWGSVHSDR